MIIIGITETPAAGKKHYQIPEMRTSNSEIFPGFPYHSFYNNIHIYYL